MILLDVSVVWSTIYEWLSGPYRGLALSFVGWLCVIEALDLALAYLPKYIERKRADARWEREKQWL